MSHEPNNLSEVQRQRSGMDDQQNQGTLQETERHVLQGEFSSPKPFVISKI
jgi:hypothetical protein